MGLTKPIEQNLFSYQGIKKYLNILYEGIYVYIYVWVNSYSPFVFFLISVWLSWNLVSEQKKKGRVSILTKKASFETHPFFLLGMGRNLIFFPLKNTDRKGLCSTFIFCVLIWTLNFFKVIGYLNEYRL